MMKKRFLALALCLMLLVGCFPASAEEKLEPLTIHYLSTKSSDAYILSLNQIIESYNELHPEAPVTLELESITARNSYDQKIKILAASEELPDWFDADPDTHTKSLADQGLLYDMDKLFEELGVSDKFFTISKEYGRFTDGSLYTFTWQCNTEYFFYNKELFAKAGIENVPATMEELLEACQKLQDEGIVPISMCGVGWPLLRLTAMVAFRLTGNDYINQAAAGTASFGVDAGIKTMNYAAELAKYFQPGWTTADRSTHKELFASGQAAMYYDGTWATNLITDENSNLLPQFGVFTMPTYSDADVTSANDFFANSGIGTAVKAESMTYSMKQFMKYFFENYGDVCMANGALPSIMPSDISKIPGIYATVLEDIAKMEKYALCWDNVIDSASADALAKQAMNMVIGEITAEEFAKIMDETVAMNLSME